MLETFFAQIMLCSAGVFVTKLPFFSIYCPKIYRFHRNMNGNYFAHANNCYYLGIENHGQGKVLIYYVCNVTE